MIALLMLNRMSMKRRAAAKKKVFKPVKQEPQEVESVENLCRTCLGTEDLMVIFGSKEVEEKRTEELRLVTGLEIRMNDGLSQKICSACLNKVNIALRFRRSSRKAQRALTAMVSATSVVTASHRSGKHKDRSKSEIELEDQPLDYEAYGDDFQNNAAMDYYVGDTEPKAKQKSPTRSRTTIPNSSSYQCPTCGKVFRMKATYKAHLRFHTNFCVCESCGKHCRNNNQLQEHKRARHGLGKIHKCAYCEYSSATKEALTIHSRRHTGERPYVCDHCGATFHRRSNLVQHIAIHLPEKNFQCNICSKSEKSRKRLAIHEYKYHRENRYRYMCPICEDTFTRPGNVRKHLERGHGVPRNDQGAIPRFQIDPTMAQDIDESKLNEIQENKITSDNLRNVKVTVQDSSKIKIATDKLRNVKVLYQYVIKSTEIDENTVTLEDVIVQE